MSKLLPEHVREFLIDQVGDHPRDIVTLTAEKFGITRQAVHRHLSKLVKEGVIEATGTTRNKQYALAETTYEFEASLEEHLEEDRVWRLYIEAILKDVPENILRICYYGFTEIFNNAIDHSEGTKVSFGVVRSAKTIEIAIFDDGIGIFEKIKQRFHLDDRRHAILELSKGKLTTDPARHSGQGIFFTSRMFDEFVIASGKLMFRHGANSRDWLVDYAKGDPTGTKVLMRIALKSTLTPKSVFDQFTDLESGDYDFSKTLIPLQLARYGTENLVSRSQAKRVLAGVDRFKEVVLDFKDVGEIGQAFADEIFRVFARSHPEIALLPARASEDVMRMIRRAQAALKAEGNDPPAPT